MPCKAQTYSNKLVTPSNRSPLFHALISGSTELVSFLINSGADVHEESGVFRTSLFQYAFALRQMDCAMLLLARDVEVHHVNTKGWTPAFSLFGSFPPDAQNKSCNEYLDILSASSFADFDLQDGKGWTCMHRAAAFGNAADIKQLLRLNVSAMLKTFKLSWLSIFCAVQFGNMSTFKDLVKVHLNVLALTDVRKWSLLHVAVNAQKIDIMCELVSMGADPHSRSMATKFLVPDGLKGHSVTPGDIAILRGPEVLSAYVRALKGCGHELEVTDDVEDNESDIFWPTCELSEVVIGT
ncbi:ankyrin [Cadophora sp. DSE1049]|nr:ankyrin [Cadophora sp. DSE1049]